MIDARKIDRGPPKRQRALTELDWQIVGMARADGPHSLKLDGFWATLARKLFAISLPRPLANEALEALRRFCVRAWYSNMIRPGDVGSLIDAGYSRAAVLQILWHIASHRGCMPVVQDDLLDIKSGLEGPSAPSARPSGSVHALPAPHARSPAPRCGQSSKLAGVQR